jgi:hypothetical protein
MRKKSNKEVISGIKTGVLPLVQIKWMDHAQITTTAWRSREEVVEILADPPIIDTVGWIIYEDKDIYIIASVLDETHSRSEITVFKNCIVKKRIIK